MDHQAEERLRKHQICAIIDAKGYVVDDEFHPREVALVSNKAQLNWLCEVDEPHLKDYDGSEFAVAQYRKTGLPLDSAKDVHTVLDTKDTKVFYGRAVILAMYEWMKTDERPYLGVKSKKLLPILDMWGIPYVPLFTQTNDRIDRLLLSYATTRCKFHKREGSTCALSKASALWNVYLELYF